jgi:signal transduction histidine kinase
LNWRDYLADRVPLLLAFAFGLLFLLLVIQLGFTSLAAGEVLYILLLAGVFTSLILALDYARQRGFRRALRRALEDPRNDTPLPPGSTREQRAFRQLLQDRQRRLAHELRMQRTQADDHRAFVDLWVHQMKTPLSVLELTAQQAEGDSDTWDSVSEELERLSHGLDLMLQAARLERFDLDLRPASVDLRELARGVVNDLKRSWIRSGVFPRIDAPDAPVMVETDPKWFEVVLRQLLSNAIKYSEPGGEVLIGIEPGTGGVTLCVRDQGIGIPPEDLPRVFERFFTGTNGRLRRASTGMGLYLAARICGHLGHSLEIDSAPGQGTVVRMHFSHRSLHRLG